MGVAGPVPVGPVLAGSVPVGPVLAGPVVLAAREPSGRSPSCRRPVPFVVVGVVAAIVVANLLGHLAHVTIGPVGIGFGWVIPVFIIVFIVRRLARNR